MRSEVLEHFNKVDKELYGKALYYNDQIEDLSLNTKSDRFLDLVRNIIYQQLSGKSGDAIYKRFVNLFLAISINPQNVNSKTVDELKSVGLSRPKANYIKNIATSFINNPDIYNNLDNLTDEEVITELTKIKGIGKWTAEMFLMSTLNREDVYSLGDLGLKKGMIILYNKTSDLSISEILNYTEKWSPYKTYASRILWKIADDAKK